MFKRIQGFSLVELSIVLIIIGLLISGMVAGLSLMQQSKLTGVIGEVAKYRLAISDFQARYFFLPGDLPNATSYWSGGVTVDGNGDGSIFYNGLLANEGLRAWQHLSLSGILPGKFSGFATVPPHGADPTNSPTSAASGGLYALLDTGTITDAGSLWPATLRNVIWLGATTTGNGVGSFPYTPLFTPGEAQSIDGKIDDGIPKSGQVWGCTDWQCLDTGQGNDTGKTCINAKVYATDFKYAGCHLVFDIIDANR